MGLTPYQERNERVRLERVVLLYRRYARDWGGLDDVGGLNRLIDGQESSDADIAFAFIDFLSWFNTTGTLTGYTPQSFPFQLASHILVRGVTVCLLESVTLLGMRNSASYSAGGHTFSTESRIPMLQGWTAQMRATVEQKMMALKASLNVEGALGGGTGLPSPYMDINLDWYLGWGGVPATRVR